MLGKHSSACKNGVMKNHSGPNNAMKRMVKHFSSADARCVYMLFPLIAAFKDAPRFAQPYQTHANTMMAVCLLPL